MLNRKSNADVIKFLTETVGIAPPQLIMQADISSEGKYGINWLTYNGDIILVVQREGSDFSIKAEYEVATVEDIHLLRHFGCASLEIKVNGIFCELVKFSIPCIPEFERAHKLILSAISQQGDEQSRDSTCRSEKSCREDEVASGILASEKLSRVGRLKQKFNFIRSKAGVLTRLLIYLSPYRRRALGLSGLILAGSAFQLVPPYCIKILVDDVLSGGNEGRSGLSLVIVILLVTQVAAAGISIVRGRLSAWIGGRISMDLRAQLFKHIQTLSMSFFDKKTSATIVAHMTQDTRVLNIFCREVMEQHVVNFILVLGIGFIVFYINPILAFWILLPLPVAALFVRIFVRKMMAKYRGLWQAWMYLYRIANNTISGIKLIKASGREKIEIIRFDRENTSLFDHEIDVAKTVSVYFPILALTMGSGTFFIWMIGGLNVLSGQITIGSLLAFIAYAAMLYGPVQGLLRIGESASRAITSTERVFSILDTKSEVSDPENGIILGRARGEISFKKVSFGYDKGKPVLQDISVDVRSGEVIGLVGHSGAGKTTMMNLLCRFFDVDDGSVSIDGTNIKNIKFESLRENIGIVLQDTFLFEGTIAENISYARPDATYDDILDAAVASNAHDFIIDLKDGYDSQVGERGYKLSTGQRQMISIARAIIKDYTILILDEPTSSVDLESEKKIQEGLEKLSRGRTTFAVAHRLSTLRFCDRLLVLKEGRVVECGTHEELIAKENGIYRNLFEAYSEVIKTREYKK